MCIRDRPQEGQKPTKAAVDDGFQADIGGFGPLKRKDAGDDGVPDGLIQENHGQQCRDEPSWRALRHRADAVSYTQQDVY